MDKNLKEVQELYDKGFKCIKYEDGINGELSIYLKNFEQEKVQQLNVDNLVEIQEIKNFIDSQS